MTEPTGQPDYGYPHGYPPPPPYGYPGGYPAPPYPGYAPPPPGPRNGLGVAALVVAIAGLVTALSVAGGVVLGLVAVVLGILGHGRVKRGEADNGGVAVAGMVLGVLAIIAGIACVFIYLGIWKTVGGDDYVNCMSEAGSNTVKQQQCADRFRERFENKFGVTTTPGAPLP